MTITQIIILICHFLLSVTIFGSYNYLAQYSKNEIKKSLLFLGIFIYIMFNLTFLFAYVMVLNKDQINECPEYIPIEGVYKLKE